LDFGPSVRSTEQLAVTKQADKWAIEYIKSLLPDLLILGTEPNGMSLMLIPVAIREVGECHSDIGDCQITDSLIDGPIKVALEPAILFPVIV
jgi:hypothetical protein